jgi:hypothetical protein
MLRHRPQESNVAVVLLLRNKNGGETLIEVLRKYPTFQNREMGRIIRFKVPLASSTKLFFKILR